MTARRIAHTGQGGNVVPLFDQPPQRKRGRYPFGEHISVSKTEMRELAGALNRARDALDEAKSAVNAVFARGAHDAR